MKFSLEKLRSYSIQELCNILNPTLEKVKKEYIYLELNDFVYQEIMSASVEEVLEKIDEEDNFDFLLV